jgi:hypothetical protein
MLRSAAGPEQLVLKIRPRPPSQEVIVSDFDEFKIVLRASGQAHEAMTPEQLADCLRILALHVGDCRIRFGEIPGQDLLALLGVTEISDEQARILREGMEVLVGYLASVRDGREGEDAPIH